MTLGERIKKVRRDEDLTQYDFGKRIGIKGNSVSLIESGNRNASDQVILSICREFNVNEDWLRTGEGEMFAKKDRESEITQMVQQLLSGESSDFKTRFISVLAGLKEEQWLVLEAIASELMKDPVAPTFAPAPEPDYEAQARAKAEEYYRQLIKDHMSPP